MKNLENLKNSAISTALAEIVTLPICTVKTYYQNTSSTSIKSTIYEIYKTGGIYSFYRASVPAVLSQTFSTSSKFVMYKYLENKQLRYSNKVINGATSGIISSLMTHPMDMIKIYGQMNTPLLPEIKKNGILVFYRGYSKTFSKVLLGSSLFFPLYDFYYEKTNKNVIYASVASSITSTFVMHPVDYLKTRHVYGQKLCQGMNPLLYYKGLSLNLARIVPHFTIVMVCIDFLSNKY
jgi:hypothetical protein